MPRFDISDQTLVPLLPAQVRAADPGPCTPAPWLPGLALTRVLDRGREGVLWRAAAGRRRGGGVDPWHGTAEVWLEPWQDATVVHLYVRLDPAHGVPAAADRAVRLWRQALADRWKRHLLAWRFAHELKSADPPADGSGRGAGGPADA